MQADKQTSFRCARCGIESGEHDCFVFPGRSGRPPRDVRCITCEERRLAPSSTYAFAVVGATISWPLLIASAMPHGAAQLGVPAALFLCLLYPIAIVSHELGHALSGRLVGLEVGSIGIGFGRVLAKFEIRGIPIRLHAWPVSGRVYFGASSTKLLRTRLWFSTLMGPMTNALLLGATVRWWHPLEHIFGLGAVRLWLIVNGLLLLITLIPRHGRNQGRRTQSDGLSLLTIPRLTSEQLSGVLFAAPLMQALSRLEDRNFSGARLLVTRALERARDNVLLRVMQSACYISDGEFEAGIDVLGSLLDRSGAEPPYIRAAICNNFAYALAMLNINAGARDPALVEADRLSAQSYAMYPCVLEYRSTRGIVLAANGQPEEALGLMQYPLFAGASARERAEREAVRALAFRRQERLKEAKGAAAVAVRLDPSLLPVVASFGLAPDPSERTDSVSEPPSHSYIPVTADLEPLGPGGLIVARIAGSVLLIFGAALATFTAWIVERQFEYRAAMGTGALVGAGVLGAVASLCCVVGYRLAFNRPNRIGSILPASAWIALAVVFLSLGVGALVLSFIRHELGGLFLALAAASFSFAGSCWKAQASSRPRPLSSNQDVQRRAGLSP